jgi:GNAT superfamily N-acetyltransferase
MAETLRSATAADAGECGRICFEAFASICDAHNYPRDFPSPEIAAGVLGGMISHPGFYGVVAERHGNIVGFNFLDERSVVVGIGPVAVDPTVQNKGIGRALMRDVMDRGHSLGALGIRLLQATYHNRSLSLYTSLGFHVRELLSVLQGKPLNLRFPGYDVRPATAVDAAACDALCHDVHGFDRGKELTDAIGQGSAMVVEHQGQITGYTTGIAFFAHTVCRTNCDLQALIGAAPEFGGPGFLLPTRNHEVFAWCLAHGLRVAYPMTLMTIGLYNEPAGAWMPTVLY